MAYYSFPLVSLPINTSLLSPQTTKTHHTKTFSNPLQLKLKSNPFSFNTPFYLCFKKDQQNTIPTSEKEPQLRWGIFANMWWANLKGAIGQLFNLEGIVFSSKVLTKHPNLLLPHLKVPNIRYINWEELHRRGLKGVIFDKDNTITLPYELRLWDPIKLSVENCKSVFGEENVAIFSNSVGLYEFDPDESKAEVLEREIGMKVIRHKVKKPAGNGEEIDKQLCCGPMAMEVVMVGDRRFTDVVFGNENGFLTILIEPLTCEGENFVVKVIRKLEDFVVEYKSKRGLKGKDHRLLANCDVNLVTLNDSL